MKKTCAISILIYLMVLFVLLLTSCEVAYSPFNKGMLFIEEEDGYVVSPMPVSKSIDKIFLKLLTTLDIEIPSEYLGKPIVELTGMSIYPNLRHITIPNSIRSINKHAFDGNKHLQYNEYDNAYYLGNDENPYLVLVKPKSEDITSCIVHKDTKVIAHYAFEDCIYLESVNIPNGLISIGDRAFIKCSWLNEINIPDSVEYLGYEVFNGCDDVEANIYDNACYLGNEDNPYLVLIRARFSDAFSCRIHEDTKFIVSDAFKDTKKLNSIYIPAGVINIKHDTFSECSSLTVYCESDSNVNNWHSNWNECKSHINKTGYCAVVWSSDEIPGTEGIEYTLDSDGMSYVVTGIGTYEGENIIISSSYNGKPVTKIAEKAFYDCPKVRSVRIPDTVTNIGSEAFAFCSLLTELIFSKGLENIENKAFFACLSLEYIDIPYGVAKIDSEAFARCKLLRSAVLPDSLTSISASAFAECESLLYYEHDGLLYLGNAKNHYLVLVKAAKHTRPFSASMHENVKLMAEGALANCSYLTGIVISDSLTNIPQNAFSGCSLLRDVEITDSITSIEAGAFANCAQLVRIVIPDSVERIQAFAFKFSNNYLIIYCEAQSKPNGWHPQWNASYNPFTGEYTCQTRWGYVE